MEVRPADETLILDGFLRRDDSDRIGQMTRNAQEYARQQAAISDQVEATLLSVQQTINDTFTSLQNFLTASLQHAQQVLAEGQAQAQAAAAELERILTSTASAQVTQADLDILDEKIQGVTTSAQDALEQVHDLNAEGA